MYSLGHAIQNANLSLSAIDLINDMLWNRPPEAVLSLKDFSGLENAIIQIANYRELKMDDKEKEKYFILFLV